MLVPELGIANIIHEDHEEEDPLGKEKKKKKKMVRFAQIKIYQMHCIITEHGSCDHFFFPLLLLIPIHSSNHMEYSNDGKSTPPLFFFGAEAGQ